MCSGFGGATCIVALALVGLALLSSRFRALIAPGDGFHGLLPGRFAARGATECSSD